MKATPAQHAMWLNEKAGIAGTVYHMPLPVELTGPLDRQRLVRACEQVVARHRVLGCAFAEVDGELCLVRAPRRPEVVFDPEDPLRPFDLEQGPLIRFSLTELGDRRHLLLITAHHLVFDGQSKDILLRDLAAHYNRPSTSTSTFTSTDVPARDVGVIGESAGTDAFEVPQVDDVTLPGLRQVPRTAEPGDRIDFELADLCFDGMTRFELLLAAMVALLVRYGNTEPTIAVDLGNRTAETAESIGPFVNELPLRPPVHAGQNGRECATAVRATLRESYALRNVAPRGNPHLSLAPVSISYRRRGPDPVFDGLAVTVEWMGFHYGARNALHVQMVDDGDVVRVRLHYSRAQLARTDVERIAAHYRMLLRGIVHTPDETLGALPMLAPGEVTRLDGPRRDIPDLTVADLICPPEHGATSEAVDLERQSRPAQRTDSTGLAVTGSEGGLTYAELDRAAEETAVRLRDRGVRPGDRVAVRMRRSPSLLASLLGVWKAGAAYVPIDPGYPAARQSLLLSDARPRALVTEDDVVALGGESGSRRAPAYVIYTSGSTGRPKGVEVDHRGVVNLLLGLREALDIEPRPVWLAVASFAFDMSVPELWLPLTLGGTVVLATEDEARDGDSLLKLIRAHGVTHVHVTPSTWQRLLEAGFDEPSVVAISGAEALPEPIAHQLRRRSASVWNLYGPTETTVWSTCSRVGDGPVAIGRPLANTSLHVLDEAATPVPQGIPGELWIGGAGVARGYLDRPSLTGQRFAGGRYRTGDRVRLRHDGELEWLGRLDDQIKLRGYRIELGEIEACLLEHPEVRAAAAAVHDGTLIAYVVGEPDRLREHLAERLPAHLVPAKVLKVVELPRNANGKLDRPALPPPPDGRPTSQAYEGLAEQIYRIWCEVLNRGDIGPDDDLFEIGGHSLTVTRISSRMRRNLGVDLPLQVFFDNPTIAGLVTAASDRASGDGGAL